MDPAYSILKSELSEELINTLSYWQQNTIDHDYGGFFGRINHKNKVVERASKGIILNTRILWSFAAASVHLKSCQYNAITHRAYRYLRDNFIDYDHHGVFWELDCHGLPINKRKQIYAQAFAIYALSAYYTFSKNPEARILAMGLFELIEKHSKDNQKGGYLEAFSEDWGPLEDVRLSNKDMNAEKTMNTHLHILEAYTELLHIYDSASLKSALRSLVQLFQEKFLGNDHHYQLFFDVDWNRQSNTVSYGHDIETAWLLMEAAKAIGDEALLEDTRITAIQVINTFMDEAIDEDGAVINEKNLSTGALDKDRHWWPQVEALIGLSYAFKLTGRQKYTDCSIRIWDFIKTHLIDRKHGEWHFRVDQYGKVYTEEDKVSMWKAPYHTTRACIILNSN